MEICQIVIDFHKKNSSDSSIDDCIHAINYYFENEPDHNTRHLDYHPKGHGGRKHGAAVLLADNIGGIMNSYSSIEELFKNLTLLDSGEWIYANINSWNSNPESTEFYYIPWDYIQSLDDEDIYLDEEDMEMPTTVRGLKLKGWMLVGSLNYIASKKPINVKDSNWVIEEINYYRENDTFRT